MRRLSTCATDSGRTASDESLGERNIGYGTEGYFQLLRERPQPGRYLALGRNVLLNSGEAQYRIGEGVPTVIEETGSQPNQPELEQNFPNPFNSGTTIRFELKEGSVVSVRVIDLTGQLVRALAQEALLLAGHYEVSRDGRDAAGGLWCLSLRAERRGLSRGAQDGFHEIVSWTADALRSPPGSGLAGIFLLRGERRGQYRKGWPPSVEIVAVEA